MRLKVFVVFFVNGGCYFALVFHNWHCGSSGLLS